MSIFKSDADIQSIFGDAISLDRLFDFRAACWVVIGESEQSGLSLNAASRGQHNVFKANVLNVDGCIN